jgi:hypothetical protein
METAVRVNKKSVESNNCFIVENFHQIYLLDVNSK